MKCPVCDGDLRAVDRQGIEIDFCPRCRGVWLDRGELDKLIERSTAFDSGRDSDDDERRWREDDEGRGGYPPEGRRERKREGFWSNLFDFD